MNKKYLVLIGVIIAFSIILAVMLFQSSTVNNATPKTLGFVGNSEQASITNVVFNSNTQVTVTIENTGSMTVTIVTAKIDGTTVTINPLTLIINEGSSGTVTLTSATAFVNYAQYTIELTTAKGNTLAYSATYSGT